MADTNELDTQSTHAAGMPSPAEAAGEPRAAAPLDLKPAGQDAVTSAAHAGAAPAGHAAGAEGGHGGENGGETPELENFWNVLAKSGLNKSDAPTHGIIKYFDPYVGDPVAATLHKTAQNVFFSFLMVMVVIWVARRAVRKRAMIPDRAQSAAEILIEGMRNFFVSILGEKHGPRYVPFLLGLFFFILFNNLMGLVPLMKSSTSAFQCNIMLGLTVFLYVQYTGLRYNGPKRYILHLLGNPASAVQWIFSPLIFCLEVVAELVKPLSLSLRLFGNILGEDILLGVFAVLGITVTAVLLKPVGIEHPLVGIPLQLPFLFLATLTSTVQALIFSLLSCVYILLMLPHEHEGAH